MSVLLKNIDIYNFKSLKHCKIHKCKGINLFIGRPNVGKSNILEALSLFSLPYLTFTGSRNLRHLVRTENAVELFNQGNIENTISVETDGNTVKLVYDRLQGLHGIINIGQIHSNIRFDDQLKLVPPRVHYSEAFVKRYIFENERSIQLKSQHGRYLIPPYGPNLLDVIEQDELLKKEISGWFQEYGLSLVFDRASRSLKVLQNRDKNNNEIFLVPYTSIADTLQRMIFYKTAIASNRDNVLIFEEPEAHSFPPYIAKITQEMIANTSNQYFIATHSPFILNDFLENARDDLAVFLVDYVKHETIVKQLTAKQLYDIYQNGVDLFTNSESYI